MAAAQSASCPGALLESCPVFAVAAQSAPVPLRALSITLPLVLSARLMMSSVRTDTPANWGKQCIPIDSQKQAICFHDATHQGKFVLSRLYVR